MPNKKQRMQNAANYRRLKEQTEPLRTCPHCLEAHRGMGHFVPPSLGEEGFYTCKEARDDR